MVRVGYSPLCLYGKFLIELGDGECIHQILGFTAGCSIPCFDVLLKIPFFSSFSPDLLYSSLEENGVFLERPASPFENHCFEGKKNQQNFKRDKHSQSNRSRP